MKCLVNGCGNTPKNLGVSFHRLPAKDPLRGRWLEALGQPALPEYEMRFLRVCSDHFSPESYTSWISNRLGFSSKRKRLSDVAVPTLHLDQAAAEAIARPQPEDSEMVTRVKQRAKKKRPLMPAIVPMASDIALVAQRDKDSEMVIRAKQHAEKKLRLLMFTNEQARKELAAGATVPVAQGDNSIYSVKVEPSDHAQRVRQKNMGTRLTLCWRDQVAQGTQTNPSEFMMSRSTQHNLCWRDRVAQGTQTSPSKFMMSRGASPHLTIIRLSRLPDGTGSLTNS
uniref:Putative thap domain protein n=1 Tax=Ixodes ricinus TaxID=34613 RepID=V5I0Q8_IXORI